MNLSVVTSTVASGEDMMTEVGAQSPENFPDVTRLEQLRKIFEEHKPIANKPISHDSTAVLLLSYDNEVEEDDAFNVAAEVKELQDVLANEYKFTVKNKSIQAKRAQIDMDYHLIKFVREHDKEHALLIIYYGGHGWRDPGREKGYNLSSQNQIRMDGKSLTNGTYVAWERTENILRNIDSDVLVIFDSCDSGYIKEFRAPKRTFEYLVACDKGAFTRGPGESSFTAALIWGLKQLKRESPFNTKTLLKKVKEYPNLPTRQKPDLIPRFNMPEPIWISSSKDSTSVDSPSHATSPLAEDGRESSSGIAYRDREFESMEFRFSFSKRLTEEEFKNFASKMSSLIRYDRDVNGATARYVSLERVTMGNGRKMLLDKWRKATNVVSSVERFRKRKHSSLDYGNKYEEQNHKRQRLSAEMGTVRTGEGNAPGNQRDREPVTPVSERDEVDKKKPSTKIPPGVAMVGALGPSEAVQVHAANVGDLIIGNDPSAVIDGVTEDDDEEEEEESVFGADQSVDVGDLFPDAQFEG